MLSEEQSVKGSPDPRGPETDAVQPLVYQICVESHLGADWTDWFDGLTITSEENGNTLLTGPVIDQAALHRLLKKVRDLGMLLISVNRLDAGPMMKDQGIQSGDMEITAHITETSP